MIRSWETLKSHMNPTGPVALRPWLLCYPKTAILMANRQSDSDSISRALMPPALSLPVQCTAAPITWTVTTDLGLFSRRPSLAINGESRTSSARDHGWSRTRLGPVTWSRHQGLITMYLPTSSRTQRLHVLLERVFAVCGADEKLISAKDQPKENR